MTTRAKTVDTTVLLWWDIDSIRGALSDVRAFVPNLRQGVKQRFNLGEASRYRTTVFHQHGLNDYTDLHAALPPDVDVLHTGSQSVPHVLARKCRELQEDWRPNEVILWIASCESKVIELLREVRQKGYNVFLVADFDRLPKSITTIHWLEIYSYYVIAHGDLRKVTGLKIPRQIQDRTLGFASPIVLSNLKLRWDATPHPPPVRQASPFSRVVTPPLRYLSASPDPWADAGGSPMPEQEWNEATRLADPVFNG